MPEAKSASGAAKRRRVSRLKPIRYQISLIFLGEERIKPRLDQDPSANMMVPPPYRCRYKLLRHTGSDGGEIEIAGLTPIPNQVDPGDADPAAERVAKFLKAGGTAENPPGDQVFKIMVLDNHGTRTAENLTLLGGAGDNTSNPDYYKSRGWLGDVIPAVPFRVVVRRFIGDTQKDLIAGLKAVVQVKDCKEEFAQNDGRRKDFLEEFFKKYNRQTGTDTAGDDNMLKRFAQTSDLARDPAAEEGANAEKVLRKLTYASLPVVDQASAALAQQEWGATSAATSSAQAHRAAQFDLELKDETLPDGKKVKVGVTDFVMAPWPAGGDNYRLLVGLFKGSEDVRDTKDKGRKVKLLDDQLREIKKPRHYATPRFVMWRKIEFALCVLANNLGQDALNWDAIIAMYRKCFVEVTKPIKFFNLTRDAWFNLVKSKTPNNGNTNPVFNNAANWTDAVYSTQFYPNALRATAEIAGPNDTGGNPTGGNARDIIVECAKTAIANAAGSVGLPNPQAGDPQSKQNDGNGCYMFIIKDGDPSTALGSYFGDRCFWFQQPNNNGVANATSTGAHEFAHLRSIRHAHTSTRGFNWSPLGGGAASVINVVHPQSNINPLDHDGKDAFACLQAYTRGLDAEPCGFCALALRFYDRKVVQSAAEFKQNIDLRYGDPTLAQYTTPGGNRTLTEVTGGTINLAVGGTADVMALGPAIAYTDRGGTANTGRFNLSFYRPLPGGNGFSNWATTGAAFTAAPQDNGAATVRIRVTATAAGSGQLRYTLGGNTASVTITVA